MKRTIFIVCAILLCTGAFAQSPQLDTLSRTDSLLLMRAGRQLDSTLIGQSIFDALEQKQGTTAGSVTVNQSPQIRQAVLERAALNKFKPLKGYRIRIYFSNEQNARNASVAAAERFSSTWPEYNVYRIFENPNFKVTVGDFRTRSEAMALLSSLRSDFPSAFIVKEDIQSNY